ncbi:MAG: hypothetical protein ACREFL_01110 [Stellaceae bacterium]
MKPRRLLPQVDSPFGGEPLDSHDFIFEFFAGAAGAALEPVLIEDCEAAYPALVLL